MNALLESEPTLPSERGELLAELRMARESYGETRRRVRRRRRAAALVLVVAVGVAFGAGRSCDWEDDALTPATDGHGCTVGVGSGR